MACVFVLRQWVIRTYIGSGYPFVLWGSCFWCVFVCVCVCVRAVLLLLCPLYNPVGVVLLSLLCVGSLYSLWSFTRFCAK